MTAGCSAFKSDPPPEPKPTETTALCGGLFGEQGGTALRGLLASPEVRPASRHEGAKPERVAAAMKAGSRPGALASVCRFTVPPNGEDAQSVNVKFGWTPAPERQKKYSLEYAAGSSFIELGFPIETDGESAVYFACRAPGHRTRTVKGVSHLHRHAVTGLDAEEKDRARAQVLLSAASRMRDALRCTNKPGLSPDSTLRDMPGNKRAVAEQPLRWPRLPETGPAPTA